MLKLRLITAVILIIAVVCGIFYLPLWIFNIFAALITAIAAWELATMFWPTRFLQQWIFLAIVMAGAIFGLLFFPATLLSLGAIWWIIAPTLLALYVKRQGILIFPSAIKYLLGVLIFAPFLIALIALQARLGPSFLLFALVLVWVNDIGAYFAGRLFGKHYLAPNISPKKTWEGFIGGMITALLIIAIGGFLFNIQGIKWVSWLVLGVVVSLWAVIGDLFESMLKRLANKKDSSQLLPGHGGVYDRIDSLTSALPLLALGVLLFL